MENLRTKRKNILKVFNKYFIIPLISGFLIALSFPKYFIPFSFLIGFFFLFKSLVEDSFKKHIFISFLTGFFFSLFAFGWLTYAMEVYLNTSPLLAKVILILFSIIFSIYQFVIFSLILFPLKRFIKTNVFIIAPFIWVVIEITREFFPFTGFPWNLLGYTLSPISEIAQISSIGGVYLLSLLAMYLSVGIFSFFYYKKFKSSIALLTLLLIFVLIYTYGYIRINNFTEKGIKKRVALVQGNIKQNEKLDKTKKKVILEKYIKLVKEADRFNPDIIILPESSLPFYPSYIDDLYIKFFSSLKDIKTKTLLIGIDDVILTEDNEIRVFNTITLFNKKGLSIDQYRKIKLVPFGEYTPKFFKIFAKLIPYLTTGIDFSTGERKNLIRYKEFKIIPLICFESIFPYFVADFSKKGNIIVNTTNDAWFGNTSAPYQHFEMARLRAIETGKYLVRIANTGISAIISPTGRIEKSLKLNETGVLIGDVYLLEDKTFFVSHLKLIYSFYVIFPIMLIVFFVLKERKEKLCEKTEI